MQYSLNYSVTIFLSTENYLLNFLMDCVLKY